MSSEKYVASEMDCERVVDDVQYELDQLRTAVRLSAEGRTEDEASLFVEAGLVHARNMIEFLCYESTVEQRQGIAQSACAEWFRNERPWIVHHRRKAFEEQAGLTVREIKRRLDRRVFHISLERADTGRVDLERIARAIEVLWSAFLHGLDEQWRGRLR